jgi:Amt family ammonium transporter
VGAIATGILVSPDLGGVGLVDYVAKPGEAAPGDYAMATQVMAQLKAVLTTLVWSGIGSLVLYKIVDVTIGLRVTQEEEREGLDIADHGERAYNY